MKNNRSDIDHPYRKTWGNCELFKIQTRFCQKYAAKNQLLKEPRLTLNNEQQLAYQTIEQKLKNKDPKGVILLHGVTGSGKTEVYLHAIEKVIKQGKQVLLLLPEINLMPQTISRIQNRFASTISILHSGLTAKERFVHWWSAYCEQSQIIIGTRSAIFCHAPNLGLIIVDEEHDSSFKQHDGFHYHARDLAVLRAQKEKILTILGSATPALETIANAKQGRYQWLKLKKRASKAQAPNISLINLRKEKLTRGFSKSLLTAIKTSLDDKQQVLLFLNRRGYAPSIICHHCGQSVNCKNCKSTLTYHKLKNKLICHHCAYQCNTTKYCSHCQSTNLQSIGQGTEKIEETLNKLFPNIPLIRFDRDSTQKKGALDSKLKQVNNLSPAILVGTQMLAKGHHFPKLSLVGIVDGDSGLFSSDFRAFEKLAQLFVQLAGRSGREKTSGKIYIQSHQIEHPLFSLLQKEDFSETAKILLNERKELDYPPYSHMALIKAHGQRADDVAQFLERYKAYLQKACLTISSSSVEILGPIPAPLERIRGYYRFQLLLQSKRRQDLHHVLAISISQAENLIKNKRVRWAIDVDPIDLY